MSRLMVCACVALLLAPSRSFAQFDAALIEQTPGGHTPSAFVSVYRVAADGFLTAVKGFGACTVPQTNCTRANGTFTITDLEPGIYHLAIDPF